ncbi:sugar phosphate nucleotidyltransferase [Paenibacillus sp. sgz500958]|uniref:sugar phosphate nucleotidyltransferase n=1 Tax=Paenibacillus sp. sgz500958 TaxID=3242475 RepID=UPI0036D2F136
MHTILLCGGSGQRLWPLSNRIRSKMFLNLLPAPEGGAESMIGRVCRQLNNTGIGESALFVTHQEQLGLTQRYTKGDFPVLGEPYKRGTFTAAALGAVYLHSTGKADLRDTLCVAPADMYADDEFFRLFHEFRDILAASKADIALLGTRPTHPSDQYGYIVPGNKNSMGYSPVLRFEEKPNPERAQALIQQNALWNCGVFAFSLSFILTYLKAAGLPTEYDAFTALYPELPVRSFDKEVVEQNSNTVVLRHTGVWQDLGSWDSLTEQLSSTIVGNGSVSGCSRNTHIVNELNTPIHVIGVSDIVAIGSADGVLIANKAKANEIKEVMGSPAKCPWYGETYWGSYCILDCAATGVEDVITLKLTLLPGHSMQEMVCEHRQKIWTVLNGFGEFRLNGSVMPVQAGEVISISRGDRHGMIAGTSMELTEVRFGDKLAAQAVYPS